MATINCSLSFIKFAHNKHRYARFATAAYGDHMMRGARLGRKWAHGGKHEMLLWYRSFLPKTFLSPTTQQRIGAHCGIPAHDVIHMDIEYGSRRNHLCHFVAVDHAHKAVVLSIRGTFSLSDLIVDATGFSSKFLYMLLLPLYVVH